MLPPVSRRSPLGWQAGRPAPSRPAGLCSLLTGRLWPASLRRLLHGASSLTRRPEPKRIVASVRLQRGCGRQVEAAHETPTPTPTPTDERGQEAKALEWRAAQLKSEHKSCRVGTKICISVWPTGAGASARPMAIRRAAQAPERLQPRPRPRLRLRLRPSRGRSQRSASLAGFDSLFSNLLSPSSLASALQAGAAARRVAKHMRAAARPGPIDELIARQRSEATSNRPAPSPRRRSGLVPGPRFRHSEGRPGLSLAGAQATLCQPSLVAKSGALKSSFSERADRTRTHMCSV